MNASRLLAGFGIEHATFWTCECAAIAAVFALFPVITRGQTPAQKLLRLRIVRPDAAPASGGQIVCRYATLFAIVLLPAWAFGLVAGVDDIPTTPAELRALASLCVHDKTALTLIWCAGVLAWAATLAMRAWRAWRGRAPFIMLNGLISDTRIMTEDGIKQILNQLHVALSIPDMQISERNDANVLPAGAQIMCNGLHFLHHLSNRSPPIRRHK